LSALPPQFSSSGLRENFSLCADVTELNVTASGVCFFTFKGLKAKDIHVEFASVHGLEAFVLLTVKKWWRRFQQGRTDLFDDPRFRKPLTNDLGEVIDFTLAEKLFNSSKALCRHLPIEKMTCLRILHDKLGLKKCYLRWVPHVLSVNQKTKE
jgi:hypothetical protein